MSDAPEYVASESPFVVRRRVRWSDCDPAGVAFTGRFVDYMLSAVDLFTRHIAGGVARAEFMQGLGVDTPCKGLSMTFHVALAPEDCVDIEVAVGRIGDSSWDLGLRARLPDGRLAFEGVFSPVCIHQSPRRKASIPAVLRERLQAHRLSEG